MMVHPGLSPGGAPASPAVRRSSRWLRGPLANLGVSQMGWWAAVLGAAWGHPLAGTVGALAAIGWHLCVVPRPLVELQLVGLACLVGAAAETVVVALGSVAYPSGQPFSQLPPYWIVALWGLFAIGLNVTLRWLRGRPILAAALGALAGPMAFSAGVRLGGARFVEPTAALATLAVVWAIALPLLVALSVRFDGVSRKEEDHA